MPDAKDIFGEEPETDEIQEKPTADAVINTPEGSFVVDHKTTGELQGDLIEVISPKGVVLKYPKPAVPATRYGRASVKLGQIDYILKMLGYKDFSKSNFDPELIRAKAEAGVFSKHEASELIAEMRYLPRLK